MRSRLLWDKMNSYVIDRGPKAIASLIASLWANVHDLQRTSVHNLVYRMTMRRVRLGKKKVKRSGRIAGNHVKRPVICSMFPHPIDQEVRISLRYIASSLVRVNMLQAL